jgi:hypothetical protein
MTERFDDALLDEFAHNFYGYGNYNGRYWFIGMEEGGGDSFAEVSQRLHTWADRGKRELEDVAEYHAAIGMTYLFGERPTLQRTWAKLIRILLSQDGAVPTTEQVREYQRTALGRPEGDTCLVELLPLPSPSTSHWLYAVHSQLAYLASRELYKQAFLAPRMAHLKRRIDECKPSAVIFYSLVYRNYWREIARGDFSLESDGIYTSRGESSLFVMTRHPAAKGVTSEYFHHVGRLISTHVTRQ